MKDTISVFPELFHKLDVVKVLRVSQLERICTINKMLRLSLDLIVMQVISTFG